MSTVLVTGGSGFIGGHCILQLLAAGHRVRTTVRNLAREPEVRALLKGAGADAGASLSFVAADLAADAGWAEAAQGCDYVLHVASPFPAGVPKYEDELIVPARDGALRLLRAARTGGVKRVVLTSSFAAIGYGHGLRSTTFDETTWTDPEGGDVSAYAKSKTLAERAAWDFIDKAGGGLELSVVNPVGVFGPVLGPDTSTSITIVQRLMDGMPGVPKMRFGVVDVRDVADLHLRTMIDQRAKGERFLAVAGDFMWFREIAATLKARTGALGKRVPTRELPNWLVRVAATLLDPALEQVVPELGKSRNATSAKAKRLLGWAPRAREDARAATAESLARLGLFKRAS
jgi:nucleoside-diphosphate-sugar epimerase